MILGPLKVDKEVKKEEPKEATKETQGDKKANSTKAEKQVTAKKVEAPQGKQELTFSHWGR